jgi:hypothetical protein
MRVTNGILLRSSFTLLPVDTVNSVATEGKPNEIIEQLWDQLVADNVEEFKQAVARQQMPMFTYIYADHHGTVLGLLLLFSPRN